MVEQKCQAVLVVIAEGRMVIEVGGRWKVSRQTLHAWLAISEAEWPEGPGRAYSDLSSLTLERDKLIDRVHSTRPTTTVTGMTGNYASRQRFVGSTTPTAARCRRWIWARLSTRMNPQRLRLGPTSILAVWSVVNASAGSVLS